MSGVTHTIASLVVASAVALASPTPVSATTSTASPEAARLDDEPENAPSNCPYCEGDAELMKASGLVSHGGFEFAETDTAGIDALLAEIPIRWGESEHFELGFALGSHRVKQSEKEKIRAELTRLKEALPNVDPKTKTLDPWLRVHLSIQRFEDAYRRFLEIMRVDQSVFPGAGHGAWVRGRPYYGEGPHLGMVGKFEVLAVPSASQQVTFLRDQFGLKIRNTQKWNVRTTDSLLLVTNLTEDGITNDEQLHNVFVFNLTHNFVDGYKHYSYDTPLYLKEGLAHVLERELNPKFNSFSFSEGGLAKKLTKSDWLPEVKKLIAKGDAPRMAELISLQSFAEFEPRHHLACWSIVEYLLATNPEGFAAINGALHGIKGADGLPDGSNMNDRHRDAFKEHLGVTYAEFDAAWRAWVEAQ